MPAVSRYDPQQVLPIQGRPSPFRAMLVRLGRWTLRWRWTTLPVLFVALACRQTLAAIGVSDPPQAESPIDDEYESDIRKVAAQTQLKVANPEEGAIVGPNPHVHVNLFTADTDGFSRVFKDSHLCLRLDDLPYSCWPISFARMKLAGLPEGPHELTAVLLHPKTRKVLVSSDTVDFRSHPNPGSLNEAPPPAPVAPAPQIEAPASSAVPVAPEVVAIDVPMLVVSHPTELSGTGPDFHVVSELHVSNMTLFRHLFANEFVCLSLDNAPSSCWPLSQSDLHPLFVGVPDGLHTLIASLTHPTEGHIIPETKSKRRTFFSLESEEASASALDVPRKGESLSLLHGGNPPPRATTTGPTHPSASTDPPPSPPPAERQQQPTQQEASGTAGKADGEGNGATAAAPAPPSKRFSATRLEPAIILEVEVDGQPVSLTFHRRSNRTQVAEQFCRTHGEQQQDDGTCIPSILSILEANLGHLDSSTPLVVQ